jgi:hypothetical protein
VLARVEVALPVAETASDHVATIAAVPDHHPGGAEE